MTAVPASALAPPGGIIREEQRAGPAEGPPLFICLKLMGGRSVQTQSLTHQLALQRATGTCPACSQLKAQVSTKGGGGGGAAGCAYRCCSFLTSGRLLGEE